jgi:hypothetical protein
MTRIEHSAEKHDPAPRALVTDATTRGSAEHSFAWNGQVTERDTRRTRVQATTAN